MVDYFFLLSDIYICSINEIVRRLYFVKVGLMYILIDF